MNSIISQITFASILSLATSHADVLAGWDFDDLVVETDLLGDTYDLPANTTGVNVVEAKLILSEAVNPSTGSDRYGFKIDSVNQTTSLEDAIIAGHYIQFSLSASPGYAIGLSSLEMLGQSTSTGADNIAVFSNVGGFVAGAELASVSGISGNTGGFDTDASGFGAPIDLSGASFQGLESVDFRIYGWNTGGTTGSTDLRSLSGDDLVINGSVNQISAIPEVSAISPLIVIFSLSLLGSRCRSK